MLKLHPIPAFNDNYIWCIFSEETRQAIIVDPGCARSTLEYIKENGLTLAAVLVTHHHPDHIGGLETIKQQTSALVYGFSDANFMGIDRAFTENDTFEILGTTFRVIEVPGHTLDHVAFFSESDQQHSAPWLFCGDTLFSGGCGRLFEGQPAQMLNSLQKLKSLPGKTLICCAHEYTLANLDFATSLMPSNSDLAEYSELCQAKRKNDLPTLPAELANELKINPFLREDDPELITNLGFSAANDGLDEVKIWAAIRAAKDKF